jgi:iron complex transport system substrate-binding protein
MKHLTFTLLLLGFLVAGGCKPAPPPLSHGSLPRVISLAPNLTEIICALGAADQLAGRSSACDYPPDVVLNIPIVGDFGVPSLERLLVAKPDAVLYTDLADMSLDLKLRRIGLHPAKIACSRLDEIPSAISEVGHWLHQESKADILAADLRHQIEACRTSVTNSHRTRVLVLIWNDPLTAVGKNTFISDLVTLAGGKNIGDDIDRDYFQVSGEWVLTRDPEIIFCFFMSSGAPVRHVIMQLPGWDRIQAVKSKRVYDGFDNNLVVRPGPRVMQGLKVIQPYISACP